MSLLRREVLRFFRSSPFALFSGTAVLAVGFSTSALALTILNAFSSLNYQGVVNLPHATLAEEAKNGGSFPISYGRFERLQYEGTQVAAYSVPIATGNLTVAAVSRGFFGGFTIPLSAGRDFSIEENERNLGHPIILSAQTAQRLFGGARNALDRTISLKGTPYTVVGVAAPGFFGLFADRTEAWTAAASVVPLRLSLPPQQMHKDPGLWKDLAAFYVVVQSQGGSMSALTHQIAARLPPAGIYDTQLHVSPGLTTDPLRDANLRGKMRLGLSLAAIFTLISSLNFALLLLARTIRLAGEAQLKRALGATRLHLLVELSVGPAVSMCLAVSLAGALLTFGMLVIGSRPGFIGQIGQGSSGVALRAFALQIPVAAALAMMIVAGPILQMWRDEFALAQHTRTADSKTLWLLQAPVAVQIALAVGTWTLTWMVVASLVALSNQNLGYDAVRLTLLQVHPPPGKVVKVDIPGKGPSPQSLALVTLLEEAAQKPGIRGIGYINPPPFSGQSAPLISARRAESPGGSYVTVSEHLLSPGCLHVLGATLVEGRDFPDRGGADELILNQTAAQVIFRNEDPINKSVTLMLPARFGLKSSSTTKTVVGVIADMREPGYAKSVLPGVYESLLATGSADIAPQFVVDTKLSPEALPAIVLPLLESHFQDWKEIICKASRVRDFSESVRQTELQRTYAAISAALLMGAVSTIGLYAALKFYIGSRRRELAIRACLGAGTGSLRGLVLFRALWCAVLGVFLSTPMIFGLRRAAYGESLGHLSWSSSGTALICVFCLLFAALVALIPAQDAIRIAPAELLKEE